MKCLDENADEATEMELDIGHLGYPRQLSIFLFCGLGFAIVVFLIAIGLGDISCGLGAPWIFFWSVFPSLRLSYNEVKVQDDGLIITHSKKDRFNAGIRDCQIPWRHVTQIRHMGQAKNSNSRKFKLLLILDTGKCYRLPQESETLSGNPVVMGFARYLREVLGQKGSIYRPPKLNTSCIILARLDNLEEVSMWLEEKEQRLRQVAILGLVVAFVVPLPYLISGVVNMKVMVIPLFLVLGLRPLLLGDDQGLSMKYLAFAENLTVEALLAGGECQRELPNAPAARELVNQEK